MLENFNSFFQYTYAVIKIHYILIAQKRQEVVEWTGMFASMLPLCNKEHSAHTPK